jgi:hypothetical protein
MTRVPLGFEITDQRVDNVIDWWRNHNIVKYRVAGEPGKILYRFATIEDAVIACLRIWDGRVLEGHDFGFEPPTRSNPELVRRALAGVSDYYHEELVRRASEASDLNARRMWEELDCYLTRDRTS